MKCPVCKDANLTMTERQGIEIDYCSDCCGVWLDRGELDQLSSAPSARSAGGRAAIIPRARPPERHERRDRNDE